MPSFRGRSDWLTFPATSVLAMTEPKNLHAMVASPPRRFWNVPNSLTVSRLALAVGVFALIAYEAYVAALALFVVAALTDAADGYFARLLDQDTPLGRQLDPLIDKVIVSGCYIYLATIPGTGVLPWMVTAIVVRELLIQGLRSHLEGGGHPFGARTAGKLKTVVQCLSISAVLLCLAVLPQQPRGLLILRDSLTWLAVALTLYSGLSYLWIALPGLRERA
jgi:CDP-diacylglycerol--glycerol-3-phosphate 3-phosphatidyltransferase